MILINILENFSLIIQNNLIIAPIIALISGIIVSFLPCSLSSLPLLIVYLSGNDKKRAIKNSLIYAIGNILMFIVLGLVVGLLGQKINFLGKWIYLIFGLILMILLLIMCGIIKIPNMNLINKIKNIKQKNNIFLGIMLGIISQIFASPCSTPVIIAILSIVATSKNLIFSVMILLFYAIGNSITIVVFGSFISICDKIANSKKYNLISKVLNVVIIIIIFCLALYMFYLGF